MHTAGGLEFINRDTELAFLAQCLVLDGQFPPLIVVRGPAGVGKSSLTDRLRQEHESTDRPFCMVDPDLMDSPIAPQIYQGLFLQRCAAEVNRSAVEGDQRWPSFASFLKSRRWRTAREKPRHELIEELPSPDSLYKQAVDYFSRLLSLGRFEPNFLLESDQSVSVKLCVAYLQHALDSWPAVLVLREAQLSDVLSLRTLLGWQLTGTPVTVILEYTSDGPFLPSHEKVILRAAELRDGYSMLDVTKLSLSHLQQLVRSVRSDVTLDTEVHLSWNGNLRSVLELKFRVGVGLRTALPSDVPSLLTNLEGGIAEHIAALRPLEQMILALLHSNAEPLSDSSLLQLLAEVDPLYGVANLSSSLESLTDVHGFVQRADGRLRIHNETIAVVISTAASMVGKRALAEKVLLEHYRNMIAKGDFAVVGMAAAVRQTFRLCIATRDVTGLVDSCSNLLDQVRLSQDQTIYVDAVSAAIEADPELYHGDPGQLSVWGAALAYDTSDWPRALDLLERSSNASTFAMSMRAFALQEIGRHEEALAIAGVIARDARTNDEGLAARLIEVLVRGCRGETDFARSALVEIIADPDNQASVFTGYAYRFFDMVDGMAAALPRLEASIAWFERAGLYKARAYSELSTALLHARMGRGEEAKRLIRSAKEVLEFEIRDQHIIANNEAAAELLSDDPDLLLCLERLYEALRFTRDDFSELTVVTNLALAHWMNGDVAESVSCAKRSLDILVHHDFADRDIFWPVCYNAIQVFDASNDASGRQRALAILSRDRVESTSQGYWDYRFGVSETAPPEFAFLITKAMHPVYLSHWTVELEALALLK